MRNARAFTLLEFVMALAITAITGLAVAGVATVLSGYYANSEGYYEAIQAGRSTMNRLQTTVRRGKLLTCAQSQAVVLWRGDPAGKVDNKIQLDELVHVYYDSSDKTIKERSVAWDANTPDSTRAALNVVVSLNTAMSYADVTRLIRQCPYARTRLLAEDVTDLTLSVSPAAPLTRTLKASFTLGSGQTRLALTSSATMRADITGQVQQSGGTYSLSGSDATTALSSGGS